MKGDDAWKKWILLDEEQLKLVESNSGFANFFNELQSTDCEGGKTVLQINEGEGINIKQNGYLYIYVSNTNTNYPVYFDNLRVEHTRGSLIEETHYYPFGLIMQGISSKAANTTSNKIKYNNMELQRGEFSDGMGLEMYEYKYRFYDHQIGRFISQDKLADEYVYYSPYQFAGNEVPNAIDLDGLEPLRPNGPRWGSSNYAQSRQSYRQINSYTPRPSSHRTSSTFIPNQGSSGGVRTPTNTYETHEPGTGDQFVGPYVNRNNTQGKAAVAITNVVDELKASIEKITKTTDNYINSSNQSTVLTKWKIDWKSKEAETQFNKLQSEYDSKVDDINKRYATKIPGTEASKEEWDNWFKSRQQIMGAIALLGPSPMSLILQNTNNSSEYNKSTVVQELPEIRRNPN